MFGAHETHGVDGEESLSIVPGTHVVQLRLDVGVGAASSNCPTVHAVATELHMRSDVAVGAPLWYCVPVVHAVT